MLRHNGKVKTSAACCTTGGSFKTVKGIKKVTIFFRSGKNGINVGHCKHEIASALVQHNIKQHATSFAIQSHSQNSHQMINIRCSFHTTIIQTVPVRNTALQENLYQVQGARQRRYVNVTLQLLCLNYLRFSFSNFCPPNPIVGTD